MMTLHTFPESEAIREIRYNTQSTVLQVRLRNGVYAYQGVDPQTALAFTIAPSKGAFFSQCVARKFPSVRWS